MKSIDWLALAPLKMSRVVMSIVLVAFAFACSDDSSNLSGPPADAEARKNATATNTASDYCINVEVEGTVWTYTITKKPGAKGVSHFILNLNNCVWDQTLTFNSILWATVNGQPAKLESSEGSGTGCVITTDNFVKFDDLPDASTYVIVFELDQEYGNSSSTTGWIKAGTECYRYDNIEGPCCA